MKPLTLWGVSACIWALLQLWLLPLCRSHWKAADLRSKMARAGTLVVFEKLRDLAAVGCVALALVMLLVLGLHAAASTDSVASQAFISALSGLYGGFKQVVDSQGAVLAWLGVAGAAMALFLAARQARRRIGQAWMAQARKVYDELLDNPARLQAARSLPELKPLLDEIDGVSAQLAAEGAAGGAAEGATDRRDALHRRLADRLCALAVEVARHEFDFEQALGQPHAAEAEPPRSPWARIARVLASDRFSKDLGLLRKPLSYVATGLLLVSLLGWVAEPLASSMQLAVNNLRVNLLDQQARQALDSAVSRPPPVEADGVPAPTSGAAQLQAAARVLARAAARDLARSSLLDRGAQVRRSAQAETELVRAALNGQQIPDGAPEAAARVRREAVDDLLHATAPDTTGSLEQRLAKEFEPPLARLQAQDSGRFARWAGALESRYANVQSPLDAQGKLLARLLDDVFDAADAKPGSELGKQAQKLAREFGKDAVRKWADGAARNWLADVLAATARPDVLADAGRAFAFESSEETRRFVRDLAAAEGHGWSASPAARAEADIARKVAGHVAGQQGDAVMSAMVRERLAGYDGLFPSAPRDVVQADSSHALGTLADGAANSSGTGGGGGVGGGGGGESRPHAPGNGPAARTHAQARATSFQMAARSFRVRGVLIGQDVTPPGGAEVTDLRWTLRRTGASTLVRLEARRAKGWEPLGEHAAGVLNQALRYAADGRVVATTITPGDGRSIGRVTYLHPVLADTPLGCRIVEADRLIDTFTFPGPRRPVDDSVAELSSDRQQFSSWMAVAELAEALAASRPGDCPVAQLHKAIEGRRLRPVRFSPPVAGALAGFLDEQERKASGSTRLLRQAHECATGDRAALADCLCSKFAGKGLPEAYLFPEDHTSQFRERAGTGPAWLQPTADRLGHVDLWVHTTFSLRKRGDDGRPDEASALAMDFPPAHLQSLRAVMQKRLAPYLREQLNSPDAESFMAPLEDFILLQRFFRAGLAGSLGAQFPSRKLLALERDTRGFVRAQTTIRWEPSRDDDGPLKTSLEAADPRALALYERWRGDTEERLRRRMPMCDAASG